MEPEEVARHELGLEVAVQRLVSSKTADEAFNALTEALGAHVYALREYHKERIGPSFYALMKQSAGGRIVEALVFARGNEIHHLATWSSFEDGGYSDVYSHLYGVLTWTQDPPPPDKYGRDEYFRRELLGEAVQDTLWAAQTFLRHDIKQLP